MKFRFIWLVVPIGTLFYISSVHAAFIDYFKDEAGETKWQYVANFTGTVLILLLSAAAIMLLLNFTRLRRANRELQEIRRSLEERVQQRTANLNESNRLLQQSRDDLQVSEAYIKSILDSMPLMLIGLDQEMRITQWNAWAEKISGVVGEKVVGEYLWDAYPTITLLPDQVREVIDQKKTITIKQSQRGMFYFDITLYSLKTTNGTGLVILVDDVTQQTKIENTLIQRDKMSAIGELASTMAHDIALPLHSILAGFEEMQSRITQLSESNENAESLTTLLVDAEKNGRQASAIIDNLLVFSRSMGDEKHQVNIPEVIDHALELAESLVSDTSGLKFKDIKINRSYESGLPAIPCYVSGLQQVFLSLFRHACHSLGKIQRQNFVPEISVDVSEFYDSLWIKVQHNGCGLNGEEQQIIFEPFFQNTTTEEGSIQNRLSLSYFIITEDHQGHMSVTSDVDVGTTFHIQMQLR